MAHNITEKDSLAYHGETPWHGIGKQLTALQTADQMIIEAGLTWTVKRVPLYLKDDVQGDVPVSDFVGIRREDTGDVLGVVTERYHPIQNSQAFEMVDALVTEGQAVIEVAGSIREGRMVWALAKLPDIYEVVKGDAVQPYFLLAWGHDGKHGIAGKLTPVRVVCNNTLTAALGDKWSSGADIYVKHSAQASIRIAEAQHALGLVRMQTRETLAAYRQLAGISLTEDKAGAYFTGLFPEPVAGQEESAGAFEHRMVDYRDRHARLLRLYQYGAGNDTVGVAGTAWAAYNAVTDYLDHVYPVTKNGKVSTVRQESVLFGSKAAIRSDALQNALALS